MPKIPSRSINIDIYILDARERLIQGGTRRLDLRVYIDRPLKKRSLRRDCICIYIRMRDRI